MKIAAPGTSWLLRLVFDTRPSLGSFGGQAAALLARRHLSVALLLLLTVACGEKKAVPIVAETVVQKHEHKPPHGGTPVELGSEEYHLELVLDAPAGKLQAFVMDGELEKFVRIPAESIEFTARISGRDEPLTLKAVANNATGEKVGDTSLFETQADWLKTNATFDAVLNRIDINGHQYMNVPFSFPKKIP